MCNVCICSTERKQKFQEQLQGYNIELDSFFSPLFRLLDMHAYYPVHEIQFKPIIVDVIYIYTHIVYRNRINIYRYIGAVGGQTNGKVRYRVCMYILHNESMHQHEPRCA